VKAVGLKLQTIKPEEVNVKVFMEVRRCFFDGIDWLLRLSFPSNLPVMSVSLSLNAFIRFFVSALLLTLSLPFAAAGREGPFSEGATGPLDGSGEDADSSLLILAAASLTDVLPTLAGLWEEETGVPVRFSFDATSRLAPQILQGIEADLFFSADEAWMEWLRERGGIREDTRMPLLGNELVLAVPTGGEFQPGEPSQLTDPELRLLAVAGENVPAGRYARAALASTGVWRAVEDRVVRSGNVRGALEWVALGEVDAAVVYRTDALAEPRVRIAFVFPEGTYPPITYPAAVTATAPMATRAIEFLEFCRSPAAREVFRAQGFLPPRQRAGSGAGGGPDVLPDPWSAVRISLLVALGATLAGFLPSVWLGWVLARKDFFGKSILATVALAPLVLPPVVTGFLLLSLLGSQGPLGGWLAGLGLPVPFTLLGATLAALTVGLPLYVVSVRNAFQAVDPRYEEVSWTLGRRPWPTFMRVTFPLAIPGIAAGAVLAFARALGEFGATVVLAGNIEGSTRTIALAVYTLLESPQGREAIWILVGASVLISLLALLGYEALSRRQRRQMEIRHVR
jgi:molybdate transport system permease protein